MPIDYSGLQDILKARGTTLYKLNAEKVIGSATRQKLLGQMPGGIDARTIEALCKRLPAGGFYGLRPRYGQRSGIDRQSGQRNAHRPRRGEFSDMATRTMGGLFLSVRSLFVWA